MYEADESKGNGVESMDKSQGTTRRTFLVTAGAAGVGAMGVLGGLGCGTEDVASASLPSNEPGTVGRAGNPLFSPTKVGGLELKNRLVRAATDDFYVEDGRATAEHHEIMVNLAKGGIGMVIAGMAGVWRPESPPYVVHAYDDGFIPSLASVRREMDEADSTCKVVAQIGHTGERYFPANLTRTGPSDVSWPIDVKPNMRELSVSEIEDIVEAFAQAARRFKDAGWDGVELHAAHAYLLSSFLSPYTNKRDDRYGGSVKKRVRIVADIVEQTRTLVGTSFPILIKVNSTDSPLMAFNRNAELETAEFDGGIDREVFLETVSELNKCAIDAIDVSANYASKHFTDAAETPYFRESAAALDTDIPVILTGGCRAADELDSILLAGDADLIGISRPLIREPDLPNKWLRGGSPQAACISCNLCADNLLSGLRCHA